MPTRKPKLSFDYRRGSGSRAHQLSFPVSCVLEQELDQGHMDGEDNRDLLLERKKNTPQNESVPKDEESLSLKSLGPRSLLFIGPPSSSN